MLEKNFQRLVNKYLTELDIDYFHEMARTGKRQNKNDGWPDLFIFLPGAYTLFIELKAEDGKLEDNQIIKHERLKKLGFRVITCYPAQLEQILEEVAERKTK